MDLKINYVLKESMKTKKVFYLTSRGLKKIKRDYELFKKAKTAKLKGDVPPSFESDAVNSDYLFFLEELGLLEKKIEDLEEVIDNAKVISIPPKQKQNIVQVGAKIILEGKRGLQKIMLVGTAEADPSKGKISNESPFGRALVGRRVGDEIFSPVFVDEGYKIKKIAYE